jgi:hypothetical protein
VPTIDHYYDKLPETYRGAPKTWSSVFYSYSYAGTVQIRVTRPGSQIGTISVLVYDHYHEVGTWECDTPLEPLFERAWEKINELLEADVAQTRAQHLDAKARLRAFRKIQPDHTWWDKLDDTDDTDGGVAFQ